MGDCQALCGRPSEHQLPCVVLVLLRAALPEAVLWVWGQLYTTHSLIPEKSSLIRVSRTLFLGFLALIFFIRVLFKTCKMSDSDPSTSEHLQRKKQKFGINRRLRVIDYRSLSYALKWRKTLQTNAQWYVIFLMVNFKTVTSHLYWVTVCLLSMLRTWVQRKIQLVSKSLHRKKGTRFPHQQSCPNRTPTFQFYGWTWYSFFLM